VWLTHPRWIDQYNCYDCESRVDAFVLWGLPRDRVSVLPDRAANTWEEALAVVLAIEREGLQRPRVAIVTSVSTSSGVISRT
jgi:uncharacterized SAM-binding protein YcdF (DUF218 family)